MFARCLEFAVIESRVFPCSAESVWSVATDFDSIPQTFSTVTGIHRVDGSSPGDPLRIGSKFCMNFHLESGEKFDSDMTVTALRVDDGGVDGDGSSNKAMKITIFTHQMAGGATASRTTLVESVTADTCRVTITMAIMPDRFFTVVGRMLCFCAYRRRAQMSTKKEMDDLLKAAISCNQPQQ